YTLLNWLHALGNAGQAMVIGARGASLWEVLNTQLRIYVFSTRDAAKLVQALRNLGLGASIILLIIFILNRKLRANGLQPIPGGPIIMVPGGGGEGFPIGLPPPTQPDPPIPPGGGQPPPMSSPVIIPPGAIQPGGGLAPGWRLRPIRDRNGNII